MEQLLESAGLHPTLARTYLVLIDQEEVTASHLAKLTGESRTNTYKLLDELISLGLATKKDIRKKLHYKASNPVQLLSLANERLDKLTKIQTQMQSAVPQLIQQYYIKHERPGIRFFEGKKGIEEIFRLQIKEGKPIYFLRTRADIKFFGFNFMHKIRNLAPKAKIPRFAFTPDAIEAPTDLEKDRKEMLMERTWYKNEDYTAPVEWSVYGDKISIISFGNEAIGTVIESPQIAESLRQIFKLLDEGLKRRPDYNMLPNKNRYKY